MRTRVIVLTLCVCVCVFGIIRSEGGRASCQLSVDNRNIIKNIMLLLCMICPTQCIVPHLINVHMHILMDPTKVNIPTLARNCQAPLSFRRIEACKELPGSPPPPLFLEG